MTPVRFDLEVYLQNAKVNRLDPAESLYDNSSFLAFYGSQEAMWDSVVSLRKEQVEVIEAVKAQEIRNSDGKVAQGVVDARVAIDEEVKEAKKKLRLAKEQADLYKNACRAFVDRGNNGRSLYSRQKSEMAATTNGAYAPDIDKDEVRERLKNLGKTA